MTTTEYQRIECQWCHWQNATTATSCDHCGAPLDVANLVSDSGWREAPRLRNILHGGQGMYMDRFVTTQWPGLVILHGYGNVFERVLGPGESILVEPGAFLYKDVSVTMDVEQQNVQTGVFGRHGMYLARMTGPGRVGIQSMYVHHHTD